MATDKTTQINSFVKDEETILNTSIQSENPNYTVVNPHAQNYTVDIPAGTILAGKYIIDSPLSVNSGEANLYICNYDNKSYVAKVYRRQLATKDSIILALETVDSPFVAKLYETGTWNGAPFEIIPFYKYGSLEGKTFSLAQLKESVIPALNEGLHALHQKGIIHKDLKPSNIMLCDDQKSVAIIDFGISSIREDGNTIVKTKTGMTPEYSAPETFKNLYLEESDYYSLGTTIYELYANHTPYSGVSKDIIEQYLSVQKIPFPSGFPTELEELVSGLTYNDITNRKDKSNLNRRWTYDEVKRWCAGEHVPVPGSKEVAEQATVEKIPAFTFQYKKYNNIGDLADALGSDWKNGKRRLYRSLLSQYFAPFNQELASHCMDAEEAVKRNPASEDIEFFCTLYRLYPKLKSFHWIDYHFCSMFELGTAIMAGLRSSDNDTFIMLDIFLQNALFSKRSEIVDRNENNKTKQIAAIEEQYALAKRANNYNQQLQEMFLIGFLYSGDTRLILGDMEMSSMSELVALTKNRISDSSLDSLSSGLIEHVDEDGSNAVLTPQFSAWLTAQGYGKAIS